MIGVVHLIIIIIRIFLQLRIGQRFDFSSVSFLLNPVDRSQTPLAQLPVKVIPIPNSERLFELFPFNIPLPIKIIITIFREITAPVGLIPIMASFIFTTNSSPTNECLHFLLNCFGGSPTCGLENFHFQLLTVVRLKVYYWYFSQKYAIGTCVPYLCAYLPSLPLTFEGKSIWYFFFSLHEFFITLLIVDTSSTVASDVLTNWGIWTCKSFFSAFLS